jgi:hypothetical protein
MISVGKWAPGEQEKERSSIGFTHVREEQHWIYTCERGAALDLHM